MSGLIVAGAAITAIGIAVLAWGVFVQATAGAPVEAGDENEPARILLAARRLWTWLTPMFERNVVDRQLDAAGYSGPRARNTFVFVQLAIGAMLWIAAIAVGIVARNFVLGLLLVVLGGLAARFIGYTALGARASTRQREIRSSLPDMLDLIAVGIEAGQPLNTVLARTRTAFHDALGDELGRALRETDLGVPRAQAMNGMATRTGLPEVRAFTEAVIESQQLGVGLASQLRLQAEDQRRERQLTLQENAARTGLLILVPTAGFIFPALYVIILGPAAISYLHLAGGH